MAFDSYGRTAVTDCTFVRTEGIFQNDRNVQFWRNGGSQVDRGKEDDILEV